MRWLIIMAAMALGGAATQPSVYAGDVQLIRRADLFGPPSHAGAQLSPDGRWISFLAPRNGVMNLWVAPSSDFGSARPLTEQTARPARNGVWTPDSRHIVLIGDEDGRDASVLHAIDVRTGRMRSLVRLAAGRVEIVRIGHAPDRILIGVNDRDPNWSDVYALDLATGGKNLVLRNEGFSRFVADPSLTLRLAARTRPDGGVDYHRVAGDRVVSAPFRRIASDDAATTYPLTFTGDGSYLYWLDSHGRDTAALVRETVATGRRDVVGSSDVADVTGGLFHPRTGSLEAYAVNHLRPGYVATTPALGADLKFLQEQRLGDVRIVGRTGADDLWLIAFDASTSPPSTWLYDRRRRSVRRLFTTRPALEQAPLLPMRAIKIRARDGTRLVSYLTRPKGNGPAPLVLYVHGGPWTRDVYGYNAYHQWLANRGYAVLSVNYRGSTGFGKSFVSAGDREWGRAMQHDLIDAAGWAIERGVTTRDHIAIMGASYGGYATLVGLTTTPDRFACGVDLVGPTNLVSQIAALPPGQEAERRNLHRRVGDPTTEAGRAMLIARSPLTHVDRVARPLLIGQGGKDPIVDKSESDRFVAALRRRGVPVTYLVFPDEGHGFARPANHIAFNAVVEEFLAGCLGGRAEPKGTDLASSSAIAGD